MWGFYQVNIDKFFDRVDHQIDLLATYPGMGQRLDQVALTPNDYRELVVDDYIQFYTIQDRDVTGYDGVIRVLRLLSAKADYMVTLGLGGSGK